MRSASGLIERRAVYLLRAEKEHAVTQVQQVVIDGESLLPVVAAMKAWGEPFVK